MFGQQQFGLSPFKYEHWTVLYHSKLNMFRFLPTGSTKHTFKNIALEILHYFVDILRIIELIKTCADEFLI